MIIWTQNALNDLNECLDFLSTKSVDTAVKLYNAVYSEVSLLDDFPRLGRIYKKISEF